MTEKLQIVHPELLDDLKLQPGSHPDMQGNCFMEAFSLLTGQKKTARPAGVDARICGVMQSWNDSLQVGDATRAQIMKPLFVEVMNTAPATTCHWVNPSVQKELLFGPLQVAGWHEERNVSTMIALVKRLCALAKADLEQRSGTEQPSWSALNGSIEKSITEMWNDLYMKAALKEAAKPTTVTKSFTWLTPVPSDPFGISLNKSLTVAGVVCTTG